MAYTIYKKNGQERLAVIEESLQPNAGRFAEPQLEYNGTWMGECFITVNIKSPVPIDFAIGDYVMYRGEKFVINYDPSVIKKATKKSTGDAFCYDNVKFSALSYELSDIRMLDYVEGDNNMHYVGLPVFSFFCNDIDDFADRLQVNTDRYCEKNGITDGYKWIFVTPSSSRSASRAGGASGRAEEAYGDTFGKYGPWVDNEKNNQNISIDNMSVWDAMKYIKDSFGLNFVIRGRVVIIGAAGMPTKDVFAYGKGNGLYEIERVADTEQQIVTKLYSYGSDKNMPERYYANVDNSDLPNNLAVGFLMMPGFPTQSLYQWVKTHQGTNCNDSTGYATWPPNGYSAYFSKDAHLPYVMSANAYEYGVREATKYFNGSDGTEEIYPTIENSGIDTVYDAEVIEDSGVFAEGDTVPDFTITLPNLGFDLASLIKNESAIAMKDGPCGGREFNIVSATQDENNRWVVTCNRTKDDSLGLYFPYSYAASTGGTPSANEVYQIKPGSKYVLIGIEMPSTYVEMASAKLLENALAFLFKNDSPRYTYIPKVDEIFMARQAQEAVVSEGDAYHDILKEGDVMVFEDTDLTIDDAVCIDTLRIKEYGNQQIPTYEITLRNEKQVGTIQRIQEQIGKITSGETSIGGSGSGGSVNIPLVKSLIQTYGTDLFLRKDKESTAQEIIRFLKGIRFGSSNQWYINGNGEAVLNSLNVENLNALNAHFAQLIIDEIKSVGGMVILSPSSAKIFKVVQIGSASQPLYRMYFKATDGDKKVYQSFMVNDQVVCAQFNIAESDYTLEDVSNKFYWRVVRSVSSAPVLVNSGQDDEALCHYIDVHARIGLGLGVPAAGDEIVLLGNSSNTARQNAIVISAYDIDWLDTGYGNPQDSDYIPKLKAPFIVQYAGINNFTLYNKRVNVISFGLNQFKGKFIASGGDDLESMFNDVQKGIKPWTHQVWADSITEVKSGNTRTGWTISGFSKIYKSTSRWFCLYTDYTEGESHIEESLFTGADVTWMPFNTTINGVVYKYLLTQSDTQPSDNDFNTNGWDTTAGHPMTKGWYLWTRETITYGNGTVISTYTPARIGDDGETGQEGVSSYLHIAYSTSADGSENFSTSSFDGAAYIGIRRDEDPDDPSGATAYTKYVWSRFLGNDGQDGADGIDGVDGLDGLSAPPSYVENKVSHYLAWNASTGVTKSTGTWSTSYPDTTGANRFLWQYDSFTYTVNEGVKNLLLDSKNQFNYYQQNNNYIAKIKLSENLVNGNTYSLVFRAEDLSEFGITHCNFDVYLTTAWIAPGKSSSSRHISQATRIMQQADGTCRVTFTAVTPDDTNKQLAIYVQGIGMSEDVPEVYWAMLTEGAVMYQWAAAPEDLAYETDVALVGSSGRSISRIEEQYVQGASNTTAPSSGWTTNLLNPTSAKQYVWNREVTYFTDGTSSTSTPHILLTYWANKTNEVVKYAVGTATQPSDSDFTYTSVPTVNKGEYLWTMTETTYGDNSKSRSYTVSYKGTDGTNGTSPYFADIDNEMDSIACTSAGKPSSAQTVSTTVSFYFGSTRQNCKITGVKRNGTAMTTGTAVSGITPTFPSAAGSTRTLSLAYSTSATVSKDTYEITVTDSNGNNSRTLYFVVNGIRAGANGTNGTNGTDGEDAVLYRLVPSVSSIIQKKDLTYSVANVSCTRQKSVGGTITNNTTEGTITYKIDGGTETSYTNNTNIAVSGITKNIQFIYKISGTTVDIETIPLVADGVDGTNPIYADIDNEMDSIACTTAGVPSSAQTVSTKVSMWNGSTKISSPTIKVYDNTTSGAAYTSGTAKNGITATWSASTGSISFAFATSVAAFTKKVFCITVSKSINGTTETRELYFTVNGIRPGANGTNGTNGTNGENAVVYNLLPSDHAINVGRDGSNYVPATATLTCGYTKSDGTNITTVADVTAKFGDYNIYHRKRTRSTGVWQTTYYRYYTYKAHATAAYTLKDFSVATYDAVEFIICTATGTTVTEANLSSYTIIDKETIPVVADGEEGNGIKSVTVRYAGSTSGTTAPSSGWQSTVPSVALGNYLWTRSVTEYTDTSVSNTTSYSVSRIGADGTNGTPGQPGADGRTPYFHTAYANSADGSVNFSPTYFTGASHIGTCTDYNESDPSTYSSYEWAELRGMDNAGVYVTDVKNYYKVTNTNATPAIDNTWLLCPPGTIPQPTNTNRYLWNYEVTEYGCQYPNMVLGSDNPTIGGDPYLFRFNSTNEFVHGDVYSFAMKLGQLPSPKTYYVLQIHGATYKDGTQTSTSRTKTQNVGQNPAYPTRLVPNEEGIISGTFECNLHNSDTYGDIDHVQHIWVSAYPEGGTYDVPSFDWITIVKGTQVASWSKALSELTQTIPPHLIGTQGEKGESAWVADLTNEMDSVSCDDTGYVVSQQSVSTTLSLFFGQTAKNFGTPTVKRNGSTITIGTTYDWGKVTYSSKTLTVTYYTAAKITGKDEFAITLTASDDSSTVRTLTFTVNGVVGDVYNLLPKDQNINATRDEAGHYLVNGSSTFPLVCGYTKNVNGVVTTVESLEDWDIEGKYRIFIRIRRRSDGKWQLWDSSKTPNTNYETGVPLYNRFRGADLVKSGTTYTRSTVNINTYDAIEFILTDQGEDRTGGWATANTNAIDSETIYVVADGLKGDGADFVSTVFKRSNTKPSTPTGGTYASPVPSGWEDGIPEGTAIVWSSHRKFTQSGTGQDATWSTPAQVTDTITYDVEFAIVQTNDVTPATPTDANRHKDASPYGYSGQIWFDPEKDKYSAANTLRDFTAMAWRAERECKNGVWSDWVIVRIKGEQGAGIKQATLIRNSWAKSTWESYCTKTTATAWTDDNGDITANCRIGDIFIVQGEATDTHDYYTLYQRLSSISSTGKCNGYTVSYTIGKKGDDGTSVSITATETKYVKKETKPTEAQFNSSTYTNDNFPPFAIGETWWSRTTVTYSDGTTTKAYGVNKIGQDGSSGTPGAPGIDGRTTYFHIAYANTSNNSDSSFSTTYFAGAKFIGTCTDFNEADPTTFSSYEWKEFKGENGLGLTAPPELVETATSHTLASSASSGVTISTAGWDTVTVSTPTLKYIWKYISYSYEAAVPNLLKNSLNQWGIAMTNATYIAKVPLWEPLVEGETYTLTFHSDNLKETDPSTGARLYSITSLTVRTRHNAYLTSSTNLLTHQSGYQVHDGNIYCLTFKCKAAANYSSPGEPNPSNAIYLQSVGFNPYTAGVCPNISWMMLTKGESGYSWQEAPQGAAHNDSPWITGVYGDKGGSITNAVLIREGSSYTDSWWQNKISDTSEITWSNAAIVNEKCRPGDMFAVQGESYQTGNKYTLYYMYTSGSGTSAKGTYVSHQVSYKGNGIVSQTEYYLISESDSGVYTDTVGWTTTMPTPTLEKPYLWNYEVTTYTEGNPKTTNPHVIYNLAQGAAGNNYISGVTNYYLAHANNTGVTRSTSGWVTDPTASAAQTSATKRYLWNYEVVEWTAPEEGRNLLTTKVANGRWKLSSLLADDNRATVTASVKLTVPEGKTHIKFALYGKNANDQSTYSIMANVAAPAGEHTLSATFVYNFNNYTSITEFRVYCTTGANNNLALATDVDWVKLEFGSAATAYSLSPEAMKSMTDPHIISVHSIDSFKSTCFIRTNNVLTTRPTGGSYASPKPTSTITDNGVVKSWEDGIPAGEAILWATTRKFTSSGTDQDTQWSLPRQMTDTDTYDVEFALKYVVNGSEDTPPAPSANNRHKDDSPYGYSGQIWFDPVKDKYSASGVLRDFTKMYWRAELEISNGAAVGDWTILRIKGETGNTGQSSFKSTMFVRMNSTPTKPANGKGSYSTPSPTGCLAGTNSSGTSVYWSDGIPAGTNKLWATTRIFSSDGEAPQQTSWSTPRQMTDTTTYDVEFAKKQPNDATPSDPTTSPNIWYDPDTDTSQDFTKMYWRAERECVNGVWGDWTILRIKGEQGDDGDAAETYALHPVENGESCRMYYNTNTSKYVFMTALDYKVMHIVGATPTEMTSGVTVRWKFNNRADTTFTNLTYKSTKWTNYGTSAYPTTNYSPTSDLSAATTVLVQLVINNEVKDTRSVPITFAAQAVSDIDDNGRYIRNIVSGTGYEGGSLVGHLATVEQTMDEITSQVSTISSEYVSQSTLTQTAASINSKVYGGMVNGANLLLDSKNQTSGFDSSLSTAAVQGQTKKYFACFNFGSTKPGPGDSIIISWQQTNVSGAVYRVGLYGILPTGSYGTLKTSGDLTTTASGYYAYKVTLDNNYTCYKVYIYTKQDAGNVSSITQVAWAKAEFCDQNATSEDATEWTPAIVETGSEISQTANNILLSVENVGININDKQITLNGNTQVNGTLKLDGSGDGFQLLSNTGTALITPESIGTYTDFQQTNKVTKNPNFTGVREYIRENGYYRMGMSTQTKELGTFDAGSQIEVTYCSAEIYLYQNGYQRLTGTISGTISFYENNVLKETKTFPYTGTYTTQTTGDVKVLIDPVPTFFTVRQSGTGVPQAEADSYDLMDTAYYAGNPNALWMIYMTFRVPVPGAYVRVASDGVGVKTSNGNTAYFGPSGMHISPLLQNVTNVTTTNYSASVNDDVIIVSSSSSSAVSITLPTGGGIPEGKVIYVKNVGQASTCNVWAVDSSGSGSSSQRMYAHDSNTASPSVNIGRKMSFFISFDTGSGIGWLQGYCST